MSDTQVEVRSGEEPDFITVTTWHCLKYLLDGDQVVLEPGQTYEGGETMLLTSGPVRAELLKSLEVEPDANSVVIVDTGIAMVAAATMDTDVDIIAREEVVEEVTKEAVEEVIEVRETAPVEAVAEPRPRRI